LDLEGPLVEAVLVADLQEILEPGDPALDDLERPLGGHVEVHRHAQARALARLRARRAAVAAALLVALAGPVDLAGVRVADEAADDLVAVVGEPDEQSAGTARVFVHEALGLLPCIAHRSLSLAACGRW